MKSISCELSKAFLLDSFCLGILLRYYALPMMIGIHSERPAWEIFHHDYTCQLVVRNKDVRYAKCNGLSDR